MKIFEILIFLISVYDLMIRFWNTAAFILKNAAARRKIVREPKNTYKHIPQLAKAITALVSKTKTKRPINVTVTIYKNCTIINKEKK